MLTRTELAKQFFPEQPSRMTLSMRACAEWSALGRYDKVLDLTCQSGALLSCLSNRLPFVPCGLCASAEQARALSDSLNGADIISGSVHDIPWRDNTFDVILCPELSDGNFEAVCAEMMRVLCDNGHVTLSYPFFSQRAPLPRREMMRILEKTGFEEVTMRLSFFCTVITAWKNPQKDPPARQFTEI